MARRWRVGLARSPKALEVVTAAVLITALLITSRLLNSNGGAGPSTPATVSGLAKAIGGACPAVSA